MRNFLKTSLGSTTSAIYYANGQSSSSTTTVNSGYESLAGQAITRGDHHTPLPWSYESNKVTYQNGIFIESNASYRRTVSGVLSESSIGFDTSATIARNKSLAHGKCIDNLYSGVRGNTDLLSSAAEASSSGITKTLRPYVDCFVGWRRKVRKFNTKDIASSWLALQYELIPLASDIYAVVSAANGSITRKGFTIECRGYSGEGYDPVDYIINGISFGKRPVSGRCEAHATGKFRFLVNPTLDELSQLTSLDPLVIGWNVLPWSFAIDWVYDIGGYLQNMETKARYSSASKGGYITVRHQSSVGMNGYVSGRVSQSTVSAQVKSSAEQKGCTRHVYAGLPTPATPKLNLDFGAGTLLNAAALLRTMLN